MAFLDGLKSTGIILSGFGFAVFVIFVYVYVMKRFGRRRFPFSDPALRIPGQKLRERLDDEMFDFGADAGIVLAIPSIMYALHLKALVADGVQRPGNVIFLGILGVGMTVGLVWRILTRLHRVRFYRIGLAGEVAVGEALNQLMLQGYRVFHDVRGGSDFNVDHVVVGPAGVFAVETKTRTKRESRGGKAEYRLTYDGRSLSFEGQPGKRQTEFLDQATRNAKWISNWLSRAVGERVSARAVLALPGWYIERKGVGAVLVMNHKEVQTAIPKARTAQPLRPEQIQRIAHQLEQRCRDVELAPKIMRKQKVALT